MYNISFGKITSKAEQVAQSQIQRMQVALNCFGGTEKGFEILNQEKDSFERAKNDPDYLFDIDPNQSVNEKKLKDGHFSLNEKTSFVMYRMGKGIDKYTYLGKFELLRNGYKQADRISIITDRYKQDKIYCSGLEKSIAFQIQQADDSIDFQTAKTEGQKLLDLNA